MSLNTSIRNYFAQIIQSKTGIVYDEHNGHLLDARLSDLCHQFGFSTLQHFYDSSVHHGLSKEQELILLDTATNNETSFFRDPKVFHGIKNLLEPFKNQEDCLRIWSAACSTGQEAYSLAIILAELGYNKHNCHIIASDISDRVLQRAKLGVFTQLEVQRGLPIQLLLKYFDALQPDIHAASDSPKSWQIKKDLLPSIEFRNINLMNEWTDPRKFQIILCRNVLIYQNIENKTKIISRISRSLAPGGNLILGGAESLMGISDDFESILNDGAIFYQKKAS